MMLLDEQTIQEIVEANPDLPSPLKAMITQSKWREKVHEICEHEDVAEDSFDVQLETLFVLSLVEPAENLPYNIVKYGNIDEGIAARVAKLITDKVLAPVATAVSAKMASEPENKEETNTVEAETKTDQQTEDKEGGEKLSDSFTI